MPNIFGTPVMEHSYFKYLKMIISTNYDFKNRFFQGLIFEDC